MRSPKSTHHACSGRLTARAKSWASILLLGMLLSACASLGPDISLDELSERPAIELSDVPFYPQEEYQCGPAALAMTLDWSGSDVGPQALTKALYIPARKGSLQPELIAQARQRQRLVYPIRGELHALLDELEAGHPVLVLQNLALNWWPAWHYAVVIGHDPVKGELLLHSGTTERHQVSLPTFMHTWARSNHWGIVVLNPGEVPVSAEPGPYLAAAFDLEADGFEDQATLAYQAGTERWPAHAGLRIALANRQYASGQAAEAAASLQDGIAAGAESGIVYHNLARLLAELAQWDAAEIAARQALQFHDTHQQQYEATLAEICQQHPQGCKNSPD